MSEEEENKDKESKKLSPEEEAEFNERDLIRKKASEYISLGRGEGKVLAVESKGAHAIPDKFDIDKQRMRYMAVDPSLDLKPRKLDIPMKTSGGLDALLRQGKKNILCKKDMDGKLSFEAA